MPAATSSAAAWIGAAKGARVATATAPRAYPPMAHTLAAPRGADGGAATGWSRRERGVLHVAAGLGLRRRGRGGKSASKVRARDRCPCGSMVHYDECCGRYHSGEELEPSAEAMMKARFSAYVKKLVPYVCETTHPENPSFEGSRTPDGEVSSTLEEDVRATCRTIDFQRLVVQEQTEGEEANGSRWAEVKIEVAYRVTGQKGFRAQGAQELTFRETARYVRDSDEGARWLYMGGEVLHEGQ